MDSITCTNDPEVLKFHSGTTSYPLSYGLSDSPSSTSPDLGRESAIS